MDKPSGYYIKMVTLSWFTVFRKSDHDCNFAVHISYKDLNLCSILVSVICWERNTY